MARSVGRSHRDVDDFFVDGRGNRLVALTKALEIARDGFATIRSAAAAADPLRAEGWTPELVALPPQAPAREPVRVEEE